jgi:hypothetical protein
MLSQLVLSRILRLCGLIGLCLLMGGVATRSAAAQQPPPVVLLTDGVVAPSVFNGDLLNLPYVPSTPRSKVVLNIQPSPFKIAEALKMGGTARHEAPTIPLGVMPAPSLTFDALDFNATLAGHPPDTNGDVGPNHYMEAVNTSIAIYDKTTGARLTSFTFNSFWSGAGTGTPCDTGVFAGGPSNQGDPIALYDSLGQRWIFMDFAWTDFENGPYYFCFAVSTTGNPLGSYYRYAIRADDNAHPWLPDYPKGGVWPDGLYFSANMFCVTVACSADPNGEYREARAYAFNRLKMEAGLALTGNDLQAIDTSVNYFSLLPSNTRLNPPPANTPNYFVTEDLFPFFWDVFKFHVDYVTPRNSAFTGPFQVTQAPYTFAAVTVPEPSPGNDSDTLLDRLMYLNQYSRIGGAESLWVQHTTGTLSAATPTGVQWAQLNVTGGTVNTTPVQEQIFNNGADGLNRFMGSMAVDGSGNAALGYTASSSNVPPDIRYVGRLKADPLNQLPQTETTMLPSVTRSVQTGTCGLTCTRWGDYSSMSIDPVDGCTFWYANMYFPVAGVNWVTRIGKFRFPNPTCVDRKYVYLPEIER